MPDVFVSPTLPENSPITEEQKSAVPGHSHSRFSAFCLYPDDINFETKKDEEQIILMLRQHPVVNVKWVLITLLLLTGPSLLSAFGLFSLLPTGFPLVISLAWYLVTSAYAIESFLNWYFNVYFITTDGVIDVDFFNLVDKRVSEAEINKIQDVSYSTNGVLGTMLDFGDVQIQTAAEITEFKFEDVPNPEKVAKILDDLMDKIK
jgi:hypothetical protein